MFLSKHLNDQFNWLLIRVQFLKCFNNSRNLITDVDFQHSTNVLRHLQTLMHNTCALKISQNSESIIKCVQRQIFFAFVSLFDFSNNSLITWVTPDKRVTNRKQVLLEKNKQLPKLVQGFSAKFKIQGAMSTINNYKNSFSECDRLIFTFGNNS